MAEYIHNSILDGELLPFAAESASGSKLETGLSTQYNQWKQKNTPQTRSAVLKAMQPVIDRTVSSYGDHPYLRAHAKRLALGALDTYDPQKGKLQTHLQTQLRGLQRLSAQQDQIISLPERVMLDRRDLLNAETELEDKLGRVPSMDEIANYTGLPPRRIGYIRGTVPATAVGSMQDADGVPVDVAAKSLYADNKLSLWERMVYDDLSPRDKVIYDYTLGTHGTKKIPANELAAKLGVTAAAISQRKAAIQDQLDQELLLGMEQ
jgi:DNA-directed RNA polymerase specialized sigma subunit